jgi:hypothetical protein
MAKEHFRDSNYLRPIENPERLRETTCFPFVTGSNQIAPTLSLSVGGHQKEEGYSAERFQAAPAQ